MDALNARYDGSFWGAALSYRDRYLDVIEEGGPGIDRFVTSHVQFDLSAKYGLTRNFQAFVSLKNINREPYVAVIPERARSGRAI